MTATQFFSALVAKARSHLKREAAILRQANKPQRARLDLAGQADHPGVRQTLPGGTQSSRSMEGEPKQEKQQKRRRLAQENGTDHPPEVDTDETDRGGCCFVSEQGPTVGKSEAVRAVGVDADGRDMEGAADVSRDGAGGGADVSMGESGRGGIVGLREQTGNETLESTREASVCRGSLQEGGSPEDSDLVRIAEGENGELHEGPSLKTVLGERIGDDSRGGSLDEQEEGASIVGRPAGEVTGFLAGESPLEVKRFPQNVHFRKENFVVSPVDEEKYDVVMR